MLWQWLCQRLVLDAENEEKTAEKLRVYKDSLSKEEIEEIVRHTKELKEYQETPSTKEELETIPMLTRADIKRDVLPLYNEERSMDGVKVLFHEMSTKRSAIWSLYLMLILQIFQSFHICLY